MGIGAIVRVEATGTERGYGVVTDGFAYSRPADPDARRHRCRRRSGLRPSRRPSGAEIRLYATAVLRQQPEEPLQPVPLGEVHLATDADVATRRCGWMPSLGGEQPTGIPVGVYAAGGLEAPIYLDADFLLGPEAAHLNITGVSGLATKTSAVEFLLASIFQTLPGPQGAASPRSAST